MTTPRAQRIAFGVLIATLVAVVAVGATARLSGSRPALGPVVVDNAMAPMGQPAPSLPRVWVPSSAVSPPTLPAPVVTDPPVGQTANDRSRALALIEGAEPPATLPDAAPAPVAAVAQAIAADAPVTAPAVGIGDDDEAVANTAHDGTVHVEITVSTLPDSPDVAASHDTETVQVERPNDPWEDVRECESGGDYGINTGNGFYGAYQFTRSTWNWVAEIVGRDDLVGVSPHRAAPVDQDLLANALAFEVRGGGLHHWPVCGRRYGG